MKKLLVLILSFTILTGGYSQEKGNDKDKKSKKEKSFKHSKKVHERYEKDDDNNKTIFGRRKEKESYEPDNDSRNKDGDYKKHDKYSKKQPAKVRAAFYNDYPNAKNVRWTKVQGNWTATFRNGGLFNRRIKVTYHANGERIDALSTRNGHTKRP